MSSGFFKKTGHVIRGWISGIVRSEVRRYRGTRGPVHAVDGSGGWPNAGEGMGIGKAEAHLDDDAATRLAPMATQTDCTRYSRPYTGRSPPSSPALRPHSW